MNRNQKNQREGRPARLLTRLSITLTTALLIVAFAALPRAKGDTFTFVDTTDTVSVVVTGTLDTIESPFGSTGNEDFSGALQRAGATIAGLGGGFVLTPFGPLPFTIGDSSLTTATASDAFKFGFDTLGANGASTSIELIFKSDTEANPIGLCSGFPTNSGGCQLTEDGTIQVAGTIHWSSGPDDTVQFCSDVEGGANTCAAAAASVPEPGTLLLLASGLAALSRAGRRRLVK